MTLFLPRRTELQPRRGPLVVPGLCGAPARTPGPERVFDLFASVFQMRPALVLPALPFECDVSGRSTDHPLHRARRCRLKYERPNGVPSRLLQTQLRHYTFQST